MAGKIGKYEAAVKPHLETIRKKVREGITECEIAKALGIAVGTLYEYKKKYPEFKEALSQNKGADVLQGLINAGIEAAKGYYKENEVTTIVLDEDGKPSKKQKVITKQWYPPNQNLHKFYVLNFGKGEGLVNDPLEYELRKTKLEFEELELKAKNWEQFNENEDNENEETEGV